MIHFVLITQTFSSKLIPHRFSFELTPHRFPTTNPNRWSLHFLIECWFEKRLDPSIEFELNCWAECSRWRWWLMEMRTQLRKSSRKGEGNGLEKDWWQSTRSWSWVRIRNVHMGWRAGIGAGIGIVGCRGRRMGSHLPVGLCCGKAVSNDGSAAGSRRISLASSSTTRILINSVKPVSLASR